MLEDSRPQIVGSYGTPSTFVLDRDSWLECDTVIVRRRLTISS